MPNLGPMELVLIFVIILVLFGAKKIPDLAKGLGIGIKEFKKNLKDDSSEENGGDKKTGKDA